MALTLLLFFVGFYILIKGADILVDGASSLAKRFNISGLVIGLVIVGIGTSIPEFSIMILSNFFEQENIGLGTIIGSNTFNILFILGLSAIFFPLHLKKSWINRDLLWNILAVAIVIFFGFKFFNTELTLHTISRFDGLIMIALFAVWLYWVLKKSNEIPEEEKTFRLLTLPLTALMIFAGIAGTLLGGKWVVDGAAVIARLMGISEAFIGLVIVSIGTSFPELTATFVAARKQQSGIAVGNIIGSNIFDFLMILGVGALFKPVDFSNVLLPDIIMTAFAATLFFVSMFVGERYVLKRWKGLIFVLIYAAYIVYLIQRE